MQQIVRWAFLAFISMNCGSANGDLKGGEITYGELVVPENRSNPASRDIRISYSFIRAKKDEGNPAIIFLQGGPGGSSLGMTQFFSRSPLNDEHDIVLFDARGTGQSEAHCLDLGAKFLAILAEDLSVDEELDRTREICNSCKLELEQAHVDLSGYNSLENAADVEALRTHLGIDKWILFGGSYGTRLGLTYLREYDNAEAAVFVGLFPLEVNIYESFVKGFEESLSYLFAQCSEDPKCAAKYPQLESRFHEGIRKLRERPLRIEYQGNQFALNAQDALLLIHQMLYPRQLIQQVPAFIKALEEHNASVIRVAINRTVQMLNIINLPTYWTIQAREEVQFNRPEAVSVEIESHSHLAPGPAFFINDQTVLNSWHDFRSDPREAQGVVTETPMLIVNGLFDPITPVTNARNVLSYLPNAHLIEFPADGHSIFNECFFDLFQSFLENNYSKPASTCAAETTLNWQ